MTPVADPGRAAIYAGAPDGRIRKLSIANGKVLWSTSITRDPTHEKLAAPLNFANGYVIAATGGYIGDAPPYQGHVVTLTPANGKIVAVWNSLCSDRHELIQPSTCDASDSAIWGRTAPVVDPATGDILVATGNAPFDGKTNWGDSVLVLSPDAKRLLKHWTPSNQAAAERRGPRPRLDRAGPALRRLLRAGRQGRPAAPASALEARRREQLDRRRAPDRSRPRPDRPLLGAGHLEGHVGVPRDVRRHGRLEARRRQAPEAWSNDVAGTSPVVAGGLLYVQWSGDIHVYAPRPGSRPGRPADRRRPLAEPDRRRRPDRRRARATPTSTRRAGC